MKRDPSTSGQRPRPNVPSGGLPLDVDGADDVLIELPSTEPPPRASLPPPITTVGRYGILGRMAVGGMAEIFLARETAQDVSRLLVIKLVKTDLTGRSDFVEMFRSEARLSMRLTHPNICHLYELGEVGGRPFLAMEFVEGMPLNKLVRRAGELEPAVGARIASKVAEALEYAHHATDARGEPLRIIHRDVSPHNVMVGFNGVVKLLDFGIAKARTATATTNAGQVKGKFAYMSPEQATGAAVDARSDVFALGIVLFEMLTAKRLFRRDSDFLTMNAIVNEPIPRIRDHAPDLPAALAEIVDRALARAREDRFASAGDMQDALESYLASTGEAVTNRTIGRMMQGLFTKEIELGPQLDGEAGISGSFSAVEAVEIPPPGAVPASSGVRPDTGVGGSVLGASRKWIAAGAIALVLVIIALVVGLSGSDDPSLDQTPGAAAPEVAASPAEEAGGVAPVEEPVGAEPAETPSAPESSPGEASAEAAPEVEPAEGAPVPAPEGATPETGRAGNSRPRSDPERGQRRTGSRMTSRMGRFLSDPGF